jgi:predicted ATPase
MALHSGTPEIRDDKYFGFSLHTAALLRDLGHGGQILISRPIYEMVQALTGTNVSFCSLEAWHLRGIPHPEPVYQVIGPGLPDAFPALNPAPEFAGNLPVFSSSFVGRARFVSQAATHVERHKLVTLLGADGCGKTRLAIEAARPLAPGFPGGIWLVRLDGIDDPDRILSEAARALQLPHTDSVTAEAALVEHLRDRTTLLLLDDCSHLLKGCARFTHCLLSACPDLRIIATSCEPLGVPKEFVREVTPLPLPRVMGKPSLIALQSSEAVQLFTARAEACSGFVLSRQTADAVNGICRAVNGVPLALELIACCVHLLPPDQIAQELTALLCVLRDEEDPETVPNWAQTMKVVVQWIVERLDPDEKAFLRHLASLAGGVTVDAAMAGTGGSPAHARDLLKALTDRSLIVLDENRDAKPLYRIPEPIRKLASQLPL